jgi:deazaflavin-dependent oxidoreductase (nitroreductase family)
MLIVAAVIGALVILLIPILLVRFYKRGLAVFHRIITNRVTIRFATRVPGFAVVKNVGRKSGKLYRTPVNVFRKPGGFLIALTYGRDSGWVRNVLAARGCELETRHVKYQLCAPVIVNDPTRRRFPLIVRAVLGLINANDFLQLSIPDAHESQPGCRVS